MIYYNYGIKNSRIFKKNGLEKTIQDFKLKSRLYDNKVLLKYDQLVSPTPCITRNARMWLILELDTWKVMSLAFKKFFNSEEGNAHKIDWNTAKY
jgi:hypothetical protein